MLILWALLACAPEPAALDAAPPPVALTLTSTPAVAGAPLVLMADGATPGALVSFVVGNAVGPGPCPIGLGVCYSVTAPVSRLGSVRADRSGRAVWTGALPRTAPWGPRALQALQGRRVSPGNATWVDVPGHSARGTWLWTSTGSPNGGGAIVGDLAAESRTLAEMDRWSITRVYGSYSWSQPTLDAMASAWHQRLHASGRTVELLLSENTWIDPAHYASLDALLQRRLADFHAATPADGHFDGVHLDVEPHGLPDWSTVTDAERRDRLLALRDLYAHVRGWMDAHGAAVLSLHGDLPAWYDNLPPALGGTGTIGWTSLAERQTWFDDVCASVDGVTLMTYERPTASSITSGAAWERANAPCEVRASVDAWVGAGGTWPDLDGMMTAAAGVEDGYGGGEGLDLHHWASIQDQMP